MFKKIFIGLLCFCSFGFIANAMQVENLSAVKARELLQSQEVFLLDVRTPQEYFEVRLVNATLIPIDQVVKRIGEIPKDKPILIYCAVGSRSSQVSSYLARNGYGPLYNLSGGIWGWQLRNFPVNQGAP